ncbi:hypothetical protein AZZ65_002243 [Escherichia coli]|nr:hypothetical protein AZZ65_002243 [Escherichia coli]
MFYECAISPEALFEIAIDRRNYRDFIKGFSTGGNFLYSELPKLKRNKKQLPVSYTHLDVYKRQTAIAQSSIYKELCCFYK